MFYLNDYIRKRNSFNLLNKVMNDIIDVYDHNHGKFAITYYKYLKSFSWFSLSYEWGFGFESKIIYIADIIILNNSFLREQFGEVYVVFNKYEFKEGYYSFNFRVGYFSIEELHMLVNCELIEGNLILPHDQSFIFGHLSLFYGRGHIDSFIIHNKLLLKELSLKLGKRLKFILPYADYLNLESIVDNLYKETFFYYKDYIDDIYSFIDI